MRYPLITPLASRDGTVDKDEHLVNCFGEQDDETKETRVIKRSGLNEDTAVITGPDAYTGQGIFNYDGYWFSMIGDVFFWNNIWTSEGSLVIWSSSSTYNIGDEVLNNGVIYYSNIDNNTNNEPPNSGWQTTPVTVTYDTLDPSSPFLIYGTLSNGNLTYSLNYAGYEFGGRAITSKTSGKWYFEVTVTSLSAGSSALIGTGPSSYIVITSSDVGAVIGIATHIGTGNTTTAYKNGVLQSTWSSDAIEKPTLGIDLVGSVTANLGASPFAYSPPSGYNSGWYSIS